MESGWGLLPISSEIKPISDLDRQEDFEAIVVPLVTDAEFNGDGLGSVRRVT